MTATLEEAPVVRCTVYPVATTLPDGRLIPFGKLVVTTAAAYVYVGAENAEGVAEAWSADLTGTPALTQPWEGKGFVNRLPTAEGDVIAANLGGCGCANQALKHYRPFPHGPARIT